MREMKDSGIEWIGEIPQTWKLNRIKYAFNIINGYPFQSSKYSDDGIRVIRISDVEDDYLSDKDKRFYPESFRMQIGDALLRSDDILVTLTGYLGKCYLVTCKDSNLGLNQRVGALRLKGCLYDVSYMKRIIQCEPFRKEMELSSNGSAQLNMSNEWLKNNSIPCPSLNEQHLIASFLDTKCAEIDALSADIQSEIETLEAYKRSVITEAVTKGLDKNALMKDSGTQWLGCIPAHWNISRIGSVYKLRNTKVSDKDYGPLSVTMKGVVPQLDSAAKTNAHDDRKLVKEGDFVINSRSDRRGSCGISPIDGSVSLINTVLAPLDEMNPEYYDWLFHTAEFADEFYKCGHGIVDDLWTTGWQDMKRILISYPPLEEQANIAEYLNDMCSDIDAIIAQKQEQLAVLADYKKSIIYEYVTGKKEVPVA